MFSDEKCKFYIAGSTVVAPKIRHPDRSYFARLKKIYRNKIFVNYQFFQGLCVNQKSIHLFVLISIYSIIIKQVYGIFTAVTYAPLTEVTRMSEWWHHRFMITVNFCSLHRFTVYWYPFKAAPYSFMIARTHRMKVQVICAHSKENISVFWFLWLQDEHKKQNWQWIFSRFLWWIFLKFGSVATTYNSYKIPYFCY